MNLKEVGELLRREREKQGLSLEDVIQKTKISQRSLKAIEKGDHEDLPHPVYAKGFVKNYAQCLGLDVEEISNLFARNYSMADEEFPEQETEELDVDISPSFETIGEKRTWPIISIILTVVLVLVLGWLVYDVYFQSADEVNNEKQEKQALYANETNENDPASLDKNQAEVLNEELPKTNNESGSGPDLAEQAEEPEIKKQAQDNNTSKAENAEQGNVQQVIEQSSEPVLRVEEQETVAEDIATTNKTEEEIQASQENEQSSDEQQAANQKEMQKHEVQISANEACWFSAQFDGKDRDVYLRPGEGISLHFTESLKLRLGNAGGVDIIYDGQHYPMDVQSGEVKTLNFP